MQNVNAKQSQKKNHQYTGFIFDKTNFLLLY